MKKAVGKTAKIVPVIKIVKPQNLSVVFASVQ